jgi:hypothetical protein
MVTGTRLRGRETRPVVKGSVPVVDTLPVSMRRRAPLLILCLTVLLLSASPGPAHARPARSPEVRTLDRRIRTAEHRIRTWNQRLERWHARIARTAVSVDRLTIRVEGTVPITLEGVTHGFPMRDLQAHRLERAHERLRSVLRDHSARRAQHELDAWSAVLTELQRTRDRLLRHKDRDASAQELDLRGPVTYGSWARAFLAGVSAPACSENLAVVVTWETSESTDAAFNPLATTHDMEGATDFNSVGVKNYRSLRQGLDASRDTLQGGAESYGYAAILSSLQACASADATASAINASAWCRGCAGGTYLTGLLPIVRADYASHAARLIPTGAV